MDRFDECPLAVVGMGARLPGAANLDEYWALLEDGRCAIAPLPPSRLDRELYYEPARGVPGKTYAAIGGVVPDEALDVGALGLSPDAVAEADIAHLWLVRVALDAVADAGLEEHEPAAGRTGVFVGHARGSALLSDLAWAAGIEALTAPLAGAPAVRALPPGERAALLRGLVREARARYPGAESAATPMMQANAAPRLVARRLRTRGPYMAVDAACASSFAALDLAARAIHAGEIDAAIVGGCSYSQWSSLVMFAQAQALSATGSFPFDARGDGFVSSDGYAAVIVMPLAAAERAGRRVRAVIRGIGASCDGRGKALWAPQQRGQVDAMRCAYGAAVDPASVQVVEAHATGTQVGDDTELRAIAEVFGRGSDSGRRLPIGSVKGNVGHTRETAGLASLVKMVLALGRGVVPATAGFDPATPTGRVDWERLPLRVVAAPEPWPDRRGTPRRCAVDCFGIGGLDYHVVLDGPPTAPAPSVHAGAPEPRLFATESAAVAIVGAGVVLPGAHTFAELAGADGPLFAPPPPDRWDASLFLDPQGGPYRLRSVTGAFLDGWRFDCQRHRIPPRQAARTDPLQLMLIDAAVQALGSRGGDPQPAARPGRTGVFVGSVFGSDHMADLNTALRVPELLRDLAALLATLGICGPAARAVAAEAIAILSTRYPVHDEAGSFSSSTLASRIARHLDLHGPCAAIDAEEASGLAALAAAARALAAGDCDHAFCCAGQRTMHFGRFMYYDRTGWLGTGTGPGLVPAEGAVALLLRRARDAEAAGDRVLAVIDEVRGVASPGAPWEALAGAVRDVAASRPDGERPGLIECFTAAPDSLAAGEREALGELAAGGELCSATSRVGMTQGASALVGLLHAVRRAGGAGAARLAVNSVGLQGLSYHARLHVPAASAAAPAGTVPAAWRGAEAPGAALAAPRERPRVAFVFSGQGSQYAGMLRDLVAWNDAARGAAAMCDAALSAAGEPSVAALCWEVGAAERLGRDTRATQLAVLAADLVLHSAVTAGGIEPDLVMGHSFGEYPALVVAGTWSLADALAVVRERSRVLEEIGPPPGRLIATSATGGPLEEVLARFAGAPVYLASVNGPQQSVVAAANEAVAEVAAALTGAGHVATVLPAPQPFHSPLLAPAQPGLRRALAAAAMAPPRIPFLSCVDARYAADPDDLRDRFVRQLAEPFNFADMVRRAYADGVRIFIEVGPRAIATRLIRAILAGEPIVAEASDDPRRDGGESLRRARELLAANTPRRERAADIGRGGPPSAYAATRTPPPPLAGAVAHVDATAGRRSRAASPPPAEPSDPSGAPPLSEGERLVVALAAEHTGYPPEAIHLDLDLEADLGIDSIRKAQLLGELADRLSVALPAASDGVLDLAGLVTLRDVARAIDRARTAAAAPPREARAAAEPAEGEHPASPTDRDSEAPPAGTRSETVRWVLRAQAVGPCREGVPLALPTVVAGSGETAQALAAALREAGSATEVVDERGADRTSALARARRLVIVAPDGDPARRRLAAHAAAAVLIARRWVAALARTGGVSGAEIAAVTRLGGDFALSPARDVEPAGGGAAGLVKALAREVAGLRGRVIDLPVGEPAAVAAAAVVRELARTAAPLEVGVVRGRRFTVLASERSPGAPHRWEALAADGAWIVTGGASGITARCALALGERFGMRLHLLGSSVLEPVSDRWLELDDAARAALREQIAARARERGEAPAAAWTRVERQVERRRALAALERAGVRHTYHRVDIGDRRALAAVIGAIRADGAPIRGIVHGAGFESACAITAKRAGAVRTTLRAKVLGIVNLLELTAADPVAAVVGFGSGSGRWGGRGQADYAAANELLAKLLTAHRRSSGRRCATIVWPPWDETGMAARPEARLAFARAGWRLMPPSEGVDHFLRELEAELPECEVVIGDQAAVAARQAELGGGVERAPRDDVGGRRFPLIDVSRSVNGNGSRRAEVLLDPAADAFLVDHTLDGSPILPAVISLETMAEAAAGATAPAAITIRDAAFHAALRFPSSRPQRVEVFVKTGDASARVELRGEQVLTDGRLAAADQLFASATVAGGDRRLRLPGRAVPAGIALRRVDYGAGSDRSGLRIEHGPSLRTLRRLGGDGDEAWGELLAPAAGALRRGRAARSWLLPAALLDGCLVACGLLARARFGVLGLPSSFAELVIRGVPRAGTPCTVALVLRGREERHLRFDFHLATADGRPLASALDYRAVVIGGRSAAR